MGFDPDRIAHIRETAKFLGNSSITSIEQLGEPFRGPAAPFDVVSEFRWLYMSPHGPGT
jgi:hypothetical protein